MAKKASRRAPQVLVVAVLLAASVAGGFGWYWVETLTCRQIIVSGTRHADPDALRELARVDTGMVLFDLEPHVLEDRLRHHPWVKDADVTRLPTGTLSIRVEERTPVVLVLDASGAPAGYLDRKGHPMPLVRDAVYDVPLLRGLKLHPVQPVEQPTVLALLEALAAADAATDALVSEVEIRPSGEAWLYTAPSGANPTIPVRLGRGRFEPKLAKLKAFWHQAVLTRPDRRYEVVDLRFDSQVVTKEEVVLRR